MPVILVDRLPLPNLKVYTAGSVLLLSVAVYYALSVTSDPNWRVNATLHRQEVMAAVASDGDAAKVQPTPAATIATVTAGLPVNGTRNLTEQFVEVMTFMMQEPLCMWTLINIAYCSLVLFGFLIQRLVFGKLRVSEAQRVKDKFWNYVFYKFIFVFGVINVQYMDEVLLWCSWFTLVGFLHLLGQLCKDRFEYLSSSPNTARWSHIRLLCLLGGILAASAALLAVATAWGLPAGRDTFAFMAAECVLVLLSALHVVARYVLQVHEADAAGPVAYYTHLIFDSSSLVVELVHVVHMVVWSNMLVSMASLVLLMQLRHLLHELQARVRRHRIYTTLATHMSRNYPMASKEEVEKNQDNCAICWEPMKEARKLPCSHLFHNSCLCQWVQQDASCPTCRRALAGAGPAGAAGGAGAGAAGGAGAGAGGGAGAGAGAGRRRDAADGALPLPLPLPARPPNHLFHFDGSRYVSWLPSFSVEVTRVRVEPPAASQIDAMARQVQQMFPHYPLPALAADLRATRSAALTADNILEGRLPPPPPPTPPPAPTPPAPAPAPASRTETMMSAQETENVLESVAGAVGAGTSAALAPAPHVTLAPALPDIATTLYNDDRTQASAASAASTRFSKVSAERELMLQRRKELLIANARRKYLDKLAARPGPAPAGGQPRS